MSKLADALRAIKIYNDHGLLIAFGEENDVAVDYQPAVPRQVTPNGSAVYSPRFKTDPAAHVTRYGKKFFYGRRVKSMPEALAWASAQYGITEWATSPFGGAKIPANVLAKAKAAVKGKAS